LISVLILSFLATSSALAQGVSLSVSSSSASPGGTVTLNIALSSTAHPVALQWTVGYSTVDFSSATVSVGPAASPAGKQVSCSHTPGSSSCILWGINANSIANGIVATVSLHVSSSTPNTSSTIDLSDGAAAGVNGGALSTSTTGSTVAILQTLPSSWSISG